MEKAGSSEMPRVLFVNRMAGLERGGGGNERFLSPRPSFKVLLIAALALNEY